MRLLQPSRDEQLRKVLDQVNLTEVLERDPAGLVGVIGVAEASAQTAGNKSLAWNERIATFLLIIASLNIFVGIFNLLPLLPLDGGHMAIATLDGLRNLFARLRGRPNPRPIDVESLTPLTLIVFVFLAALPLLPNGKLVSPGGGAVKFQKWDGTKWNVITDWIQPAGLTPPRRALGLGMFRWDAGRRVVVGHAGAWGVRVFHDPGTDAWVAGTVEAGEKQLLIEPLSIRFSEDDLHLR